MGLRYRGRSKGKGAWLNWSWSKKHGLNTSVSIKSGPFTWNSGNGKTTKKRLTTNLPGGFYHVSQDKAPRRQSTHQQYEPSYSSYGDITWGQALTNAASNIIGTLIIVGIVYAFFFHFWWAVGGAFLCWLYYMGTK